jgi:hypothetical protein
MAFASIFAPTPKPAVRRYKEWAGKLGSDLVRMVQVYLRSEVQTDMVQSLDFANSLQCLDMAPPRCSLAITYRPRRSITLCSPACSSLPCAPCWRHHADHMGLEGESLHEGGDHAESICAGTGQGRVQAGWGRSMEMEVKMRSTVRIHMTCEIYTQCPCTRLLCSLTHRFMALSDHIGHRSVDVRYAVSMRLILRQGQGFRYLLLRASNFASRNGNCTVLGAVICGGDPGLKV